MSDYTFFTNASVQSLARTVSAQTSIPVSVILAQMADETAYGTSPAWINCHNPAGIKGTGCYPYQAYSSYAAAAQGYANFYLQNSNYQPVLAAARSGASPQQVAIALGESPWASSHYILNGQKGGILLNIMQAFHLTQYDVAISPSATVSPSTVIVSSSIPWGYLIFGLAGILVGGGVIAFAVSPRAWNEFTAWEHEETQTVHRSRTIRRG